MKIDPKRCAPSLRWQFHDGTAKARRGRELEWCILGRKVREDEDTVLLLWAGRLCIEETGEGKKGRKEGITKYND